MYCEKLCTRSSRTSPASCTSCTEPNYCTVKWTGQYKNDVDCLKQDNCTAGYQLGLLDESWKDLNWEDFASAASLRLYLASLVDYSNERETYGAAHIRCKGGVVNGGKVQVVALPPRRIDRTGYKLYKDRVSFNIIILDDLSRDEFYSVYPQTVGKLEKINRDHTTQTEVLDFSMLQNLGSENNENLRALFTGYVAPPNDDGERLDEEDRVEEESKPGKDQELIFGYFSSKGYKTAVYDSGCWYKTSKLASLLNIKQNETRDIFEERLKLVGIQSVGTSRSTCIHPSSCCTQLNSVKLNFHSLTMHLKSFEQHRVPYLSVLFLNNKELENKELDKVLLEHVEESKKFKNTFTIITSAKSEGEYSSMPLFMIVPGRAKDVLIDIEWQGLVGNQDRLISHLDVYHTFRWMIKTKPSEMVGMKDLDVDLLEFNKKYMSSREGLIADISRQRQCKDLPRSGFGCLCRPEAQLLTINPTIQLLGVFGCENIEDGRLCGCNTLAVVSATKEQYPGDDMHINLATIELENGLGTRSAVQINVNKQTMKIKISSIASNLDCGGDLSKDDDILDHIDEKMVEPGIKKSIESLYTENEVECFFLVESSTAGLSVVQLVNSCTAEIRVKLEFRVENVFYMRTDTNVAKFNESQP
ncbi:uncharacterized protein LOC111710247 [Eurytemora carolleeae]|uniref:uncharacterized protein LOC111710247 n=1 Tax=Eurytemora carolleeae TaxID=1294199 RepID=UPI000C75F248|nr:uncharacterized protein LOC111710247 [Eurytemora carolleeae]|eukprot:XP_023340079.1 uncharacterized protein LOC111710247 [Eurytemora affinis]